MGASIRISRFAALLTLAAAFGPPPVLAEGEQDLAKQSQNPMGDVVSLPFENNVLFGIGRLVRHGAQPVDYRLAAYSNVEKPSFASDWSLQLWVKLLFPR